MRYLQEALDSSMRRLRFSSVWKCDTLLKAGTDEGKAIYVTFYRRNSKKRQSILSDTLLRPVKYYLEYLSTNLYASFWFGLCHEVGNF